VLRLLALGALVAGLLAGLVPVAQARRTASLTLSVAFFADGTINVTLPDGTPVGTTSGAPTVIPAGAYTVVMSGPGGCVILPLFTLKGPGATIVSDMNGGEVDAATYNAYLSPNSTFTWRADRGTAAVTHTFVTSGTVAGTAGATGGSSGTTTVAKPTSEDIVGSDVVPFRGTLTAVLTPAGKLTVSFHGRTVAGLKAGQYHVAVTDESSRSGLSLAKGAATPLRLTAAPFVGKHTATLQLTPGRWSFQPGAKTVVVR
jgi:hypothetical protein